VILRTVLHQINGSTENVSYSGNDPEEMSIELINMANGLGNDRVMLTLVVSHNLRYTSF
jgi:hypothetical protein